MELSIVFRLSMTNLLQKQQLFVCRLGAQVAESIFELEILCHQSIILYDDFLHLQTIRLELRLLRNQSKRQSELVPYRFGLCFHFNRKFINSCVYSTQDFGRNINLRRWMCLYSAL